MQAHRARRSGDLWGFVALPGATAATTAATAAPATAAIGSRSAFADLAASGRLAECVLR